MTTELDGLADRIIGWAEAGEQVEAIVVRQRETDVRVFGGDVESLTSAESLGVGIRVVRAGRQGFAYAGAFDDDVLRTTLADARDNGSFAQPDEWNGLAEPDGVLAPELDLYRADLASAPTTAKIDLALALEKAVLAADTRIVGTETVEYGDVLAEVAIATTTGIHGHSRETACSLAAYVLAEQDGETQTGFGWSVGRHLDDLDVDRAAVDAAQRATRLLGATKPASERLTVVLDPFVTAQLLDVVASTLSGEAVLKGRSPFADRLGETIASPLIHLVDDPTDPRAFTATESDGEGLAARRNTLIADGVLRSFLHNSYTGRRSGSRSTGSAVRSWRSTPGVGCLAVRFEPGTASQAELIRSVGEGLLVQDVAGMHSGVNPVSGDFSTGAEGLRIRGGELAEPVREFTIASTIQRMLQDVQAVGGDLDWLPWNAAGVSVVVADVTMSGA